MMRDVFFYALRLIIVVIHLVCNISEQDKQVIVLSDNGLTKARALSITLFLSQWSAASCQTTAPN